jgi:AcrR family transcriptional regulator
MPDMMSTQGDRAERKNRKRRAKKDRIGDGAIRALRRLGYANTSMRDIAAGSGLSLGMLHYYFEDKTALITFCVRIYKKRFVEDVHLMLAGAATRHEVIAALAEGMSRNIAQDWQTHRLWYDIRAQAMFDVAYQPVVTEVETALSDLMQLVAERLGATVRTDIAYGAVDGLFRFFTQRHCGPLPPTPEQMTIGFSDLVGRIMSPVAPPAKLWIYTDKSNR